MTTKKSKHLSDEERDIIERLLNECHSVKKISYTLSRPISTITREISKHKNIIFPSCFNKSNPCLNYDKCNYRHFECYKNCIKAEFNFCEKLNSAPHVCNPCPNKKYCRHIKYYYTSKTAIEEYKYKLSNTRKGLRYTDEELAIVNTDLANLIRATRSVYHSIKVINERGYNFKESTIYDQIEKGLLEIKISELPRNNRKKEISSEDLNEYKRDVTGFTYEDYKEYKTIHINATEIQMDTVEGIKGKNQKVLLTLEIVEIKFLFAFIIDSKTQEKVIEKLEEFKNNITKEVFDKIIEILLTDNGTEFINPQKITSLSNNCHLFYCHPYSSFEKGSIENIHEFIRRVIPKGISLNIYDQEDINSICNNINSIYRKELDGKCAFDLVSEYISLDILEKIGLKKIEPDKINLTPYLLGDKNIKNILKYLTKDMIKEANIII